MIDLFTWPRFDKADAFRLHKVINEPDFLPLYFVRHVSESIRLLRQYKGHLKITPVGRLVLEDPGRQALQALLFHTVMWGITSITSVGACMMDGLRATLVFCSGRCRFPEMIGSRAIA